MSETDSFIEEVSEEVRRDRLFLLFRRYGWIAVLLILIIVGGATFREWRAAQSQAAAETLGDELASALRTAEPDQRIVALGALTAEGESAALIAFLLADAEVERDDVAAARAHLNSIVLDATLPGRYRDLAVLKLATLGDPAADMNERIVALTAIATPGAPYRTLAEEQIALAEIAQGQTQAAMDRLQRLLEDQDTTAALRRRATDMIVALGGTPGGSQ